jgi:hypothetical protein
MAFLLLGWKSKVKAEEWAERMVRIDTVDMTLDIDSGAGTN